MRSAVLFSFVVLLFVACNKDKSVTKKVEGDWHYYKLIKDDGSVYTEDANYSFFGDGTYSCYTPSEESMISGKYEVTEKGSKVIFTLDNVSDTSQVEDLDKKSMVLRTVQGVHFFERMAGE